MAKLFVNIFRCLFKILSAINNLESVLLKMASFGASKKQSRKLHQRSTSLKLSQEEDRFENTSFELPSESDLDSLSEEQLDVLLQQALDVNRRLKDYAKRENTVDKHSTSIPDHEGAAAKCNANGSNILLPPINAAKNSLVTQKHIVGSFNHSRSSKKEQLRGLTAGN